MHARQRAVRQSAAEAAAVAPQPTSYWTICGMSYWPHEKRRYREQALIFTLSRTRYPTLVEALRLAWLSYKGGPNSVSKNHINFRCQKRTQN